MIWAARFSFCDRPSPTLRKRREEWGTRVLACATVPLSRMLQLARPFRASRILQLARRRARRGGRLGNKLIVAKPLNATGS